MILPIIAYGDPVLKKRTEDISQDMEGLDDLISNMFETMYQSNGVGLAAPQVNRSVRLFIIDLSPFKDEDESLDGVKKVFVNPVMIDEMGDEWAFNEGCLSIPGIREDVKRQEEIRIKYFDENFSAHEETFNGLAARVIQHEYDHLEGILFTDKINPLRRRLLKGKLRDIAKGKVDIDYKMKFPLLK